MATLAPTHRRLLERAVKDARIAAEGAVREEIVRFGVAAEAAPDHVRANPANAALRRRLREHARALGDTVAADSRLDRLVEAAAYLRWHRLLFVAFLDARGLLRHPDGDFVTLDDCRDLAAEEGAADGWALAARYAAHILPAAFAEDDPSVQLVVAPEHEARLRRIVGDLPAEVFAASDALGWTYQYWRAAEKDTINARGIKIGADELPAVTQLFTEPYMVRFLIDNTLGSWWAGKAFAADPSLAIAPDEATLRERLALPQADWAWLRFVREDENGSWRPASGTFPGWPRDAAAITLLDPCCGSGHFLTEALPILVALRCAEDDSLTPATAVAAVLEDNLHGLEIDGRCVQIASFAVALAAWGVGGWQALPNPQIAWVGSSPKYTRAEFEALGNGDADLRRSLGALHNLFRQAPLLGSLIEVTGSLDLVDRANLDGVGAAMARLADRTRETAPDRAEGAIAARGMADAAALLARDWVLQLTNVPFATEIKLDPAIVEFMRRKFPTGRPNLATAFISRMVKSAKNQGATGFVAPQSWYYMKRYKPLRDELVSGRNLSLCARLGGGAFSDAGSNGENVALTILSGRAEGDNYASADASEADGHLNKDQSLREVLVTLNNPRISGGSDLVLGSINDKVGVELRQVTDAILGISTSDSSRFIRNVWEVIGTVNWRRLQSSPADNSAFSGMSNVVHWEQERGKLSQLAYEMRGINHNVQNWRRGKPNWGKLGVTISQMSPFWTSIYTGEIYDSNCVAVIPKKTGDVAALRRFMSSEDFHDQLQSVIGGNRKVEVGNILSLVTDLAAWRQSAEEDYSDGLPEPYSDDPTQWVFHGHPAQAEVGTGLHVALARLCGYRWPAESDAEMRLSAEAHDWIARAAILPSGDADGLLPLVACGGEAPLAGRLRGFLRAAFGDAWDADLETRLVVEADAKLGGTTRGSLTTIDDWLRTRAFAQHAKLFHQRPFLWHIWDGRDDGFGAFTHYHRLDRAALEKLTFTLIGDWIARSDGDGESGRSESARTLQAALRRILDGEAPYDIFVRWKPLTQQPIGWEPDLDDGVRMNIRPFAEADVLRAAVNIHWRKDRGADVASAPWFQVQKGERINDHHTTLAEKRAARLPTG